MPRSQDPADPDRLDQLIEDGLALYGKGQLDAALDMWERVLAVDPGNEQANSYVDYVRMNYDMLLTQDSGNESSAPFGIADDEPEYQIEISEGELPAQRASAPMYMDPTDADWMIEDDEGRRAPSGNTFDDARTGDEPLELELEADEPPDNPLAGLPATVPPKSLRAITQNPDGVSFDDATREYDGPRGGRDRLGDFATPEPVTNEFALEATPGFGSSQRTDVRRRDTGFVKPKAEPPELKMTLRTPDPPRTSDYSRQAHEDPTKEIALQERASAFEQSYNSLELDLPKGDHPPLSPIEPDDLIASLPSPKPAHITRDLPLPMVKPASTTQPPPYASKAPATMLPTPTTPVATPSSKAPTKPPPNRRPPAGTDPAGGLLPKRSPTVQSAIDAIDLDAPEISLGTYEPPPDEEVSPTAKTRDLVPDNLHISFSSPAAPGPDTRDFNEKPTKESRRPPQVSPSQPDPIVSAPTRELGLRPGGRAATEDEPTQMNKRIRAAEPVQPDPHGTKADLILPFDPIDARASQILEEIDENAPANEAKEDRTRRRITTLLERATLWSSMDLERAVAAVDLALSEDPNSALAQKLIHRNRDSIMTVFQTYMGDLDRQPELSRPLHELATAPISPRAAFLLSRVDGTLSLDEILDVSGMPRLEAYRYLAQLFLRGILR
ncbi:MAG: hypothetical protein ACKV2T_10515 [Kofleriaceae bacterium]